MINPSANGWIDKFFAENNDNFIDFQGNYLSFYESCRKTGFIYGYVVYFQLKNQINTTNWSYDEITKISFLNTLYSIYCLDNCDNADIFIEKLYEFYKVIQPENIRALS